jgi:hypothetical protein
LGDVERQKTNNRGSTCPDYSIKTNNMAQTAVSWLEESLFSTLTHEQQMQVDGLFQQAKEMEKDLALMFAIKCQMDFIRSNKINHVEEIYNETYNK